jgi:UDP-N-acetylmuramate--alanine ligase
VSDALRERQTLRWSNNTVLMNSPSGEAGIEIENYIDLRMNDEIKKIRSVYFIGIGGIGMSALARFFYSNGIRVSGYDRSETSLVKELQDEGIDIHFDENVEAIPKDVDLVVYTPAVPKDHKELLFYQQNGYKVVKRSDVLQMITKSSFNICVAGTHGKTTTTTMIGHLLRDSGYGCNAFLGGISVNYGTNFWRSQRNVCVVEADEYDRSFLKLDPDIALISAMDPDHLDIYGTAQAMEEAFIDFSKKVKPGGLLISKFGLKRGKELKATRHLTYSLQNESADAYAENIRMNNGSYEFDVVVKDSKLEDVILNMGGMHNVENAVAAITVASSLQIESDKIKAAVESFKGVKRRFEYVIKNDRIVFIDDYAHHPEELRALIQGAKTLFRQKKCTIIFQLHLYTRTRDLAEGFAEVLDLADEIILLPIYPARELPIEGVSSEMILERMKNGNKRVMNKDELLRWIKNDYLKNIDTEFGQVLVTAGAGDIDMMVEPIKEILEKI